MVYKTITFLVLVMTKAAVAVKVNLQGQLTLGKEVMDTLSYVIEPSHISGRRAMSAGPQNDHVAEMITAKLLCRDAQFCSGLLSHFVEDYLIMLTTAVEGILKADLMQNYSQNMYYEKVNKILRESSKIIKSVHSKITEEKEFYYWNNVLKKISAKFQKLVSLVMVDSIKRDSVEQRDKNTNLVKKLIVAIVVIETKYKNKLCTEHRICIKSFECTKALHTVLEKLINMPDDKIRLFMKLFYEALFASTFYSRLSDVTAREFQVILNDMAYSNNVPTKNLLESIQNTIELRLEQIKNSTDMKLGYDIQLVHMILSDLDYFYSAHEPQPFRDFVKNFVELMTSRHSGKHLRKIMNEIGDEVSSQSEEVTLKVTNEVRVFLELTIDPEK